MPENDIWTLLDQNLSELGQKGTLTTLVETPIPSDTDKLLDANLKAIQDSMRPTIGPAVKDPGKLSILPENNQDRTTTIGPFKGDIGKAPILTPEMGEQFLNDQEARHQAETQPILSPALRTVERFGAAAAGGAADLADSLQQASEAIGNATGLEPGTLFKKISEVFRGSEGLLDTMSKGARGIEAPLPYIVNFAANAAGRATVDIGAMSSLGKYGMALFSGFQGWANASEGEKLEGLVQGLATGAALQGTFHAINQLPSITQLPALMATGTALGAMQGLSADKAAEEGLTWAGLGLLGGNNGVTKEEFLSRYDEIAGLKKLKAERFLKQFRVDDAGNIVTVPKPSIIRRDMVPLPEFFTDNIIETAGGPEKLAQQIGDMMRSEYGKMDAAVRSLVEARKKELAINEAPVEPEPAPASKTAPVEEPLMGLEMKDGTILTGPIGVAHVSMVKERGLDPKDVKSAGLVVAGKYQPAYTSTSNMQSYAEALEAMKRGVPGAAEDVEAFHRAARNNMDPLAGTYVGKAEMLEQRRKEEEAAGIKRPDRDYFGRLIDKEGRLVDAYGRLVDAYGKLIEPLTDKPTSDIMRGDNEQANAPGAADNAGVRPGADRGRDGADRNEPGRGDLSGEHGDIQRPERPQRPGLRQATPEEYSAAFDAALADNPFRLQATRPTPESLADIVARGGKVVLSGDSQVGVVVTPEGELSHVFQGQGGGAEARAARLQAAIDEGVASGGRWLNGFDTFLTTLYGQAGFRPVARIKFNPDYAPEGWDYETYQRWNNGQPDVVFMAFDGMARSRKTIRQEIGALEYAPDYDAAVATAREASQTRRLPENATKRQLIDNLLIKIRQGSTPTEADVTALGDAALTDSLTGAKNTDAWMEEVGHDAPQAVIDGRKFKQVNDEQGHAAGDKMLQDMASALKETGFEVYRRGGDEYVVYDPKHDTGMLEVALRKTQEALAERGVRFDYGVGNTFAEADEAMYRMKRGDGEGSSGTDLPPVEPGGFKVGSGTEAKGLSSVDQKMGAAMRQGGSVFGPEGNSKRGQVTVAPNIQDADSILMNGQSIGNVPKGQGQAVAEGLKKQFPNGSFVVDLSTTKVTEFDTPDLITARAKSGQAREATRKSPFSGHNPTEGSEIFGDLDEASEKAYAAAKKGKGEPVGIVAPGTNELSEALAKFTTLVLDKYYPIHATVDYLKKAGLSIDAIHDPSIQVRLLAGIPGLSETRLRYMDFTRDPKTGDIVFGGKSLHEIIKPFVGGKDYGRFNDYLVYRRALEIDRNSQGKIDTGVDLARAKNFVEQYRGQFEPAAKEFTDYFHRRLDDLVKSGLMSDETATALKKRNPGYAPMRRILVELNKAGAGLGIKEALDKVASPIKKLRGSELEIIPPTEAAVMLTYEITSACERNQAARAILGLKDIKDSNGNPIDLARQFTKVKPKIRMVRDISTGKDVPIIAERQDPDVVGVTIDGKREYWRVPKDLAGAMKQINEAGLGAFFKFLAKPARALRSGATLSPEFMLRNPMRDVLTAFMNSKVGFMPWTFANGLFELIGKPEEYWRWKASGGEWSMLAAMNRELGSSVIKSMERESLTGKERLRQAGKDFIMHPLDSALAPLEAVSEMGEKPTRLGVFSRARAKGMGDMEAAIQSREASTDFHVRGGGDVIKKWGAVSTFFNARLQTTVKMGRTLKEEPIKFMVKGMAAAGLPSAILYYFNRNDPDYWKRDELERDTFWFLPIEIGGRQVKIPKGEIGMAFGTTTEKVLQYLDSKAEYRPKIDEFLGNLIKNVSPVGNWGETMPVAARPIWEWVTNQSFYYGTKLEEDTLEKKARFLQYKPQTSETMKYLGKHLTGFADDGASPTKLENTARGYGGGLVKYGLMATDALGQAVGLWDRGEKPTDSSRPEIAGIPIPGVGGLMSRKASGFESEASQKFYRIAESLEKYKTTVKELARQDGGGKEIDLWLKNHPTETKILEMGLASEWTSRRNKLADLRKAMNLIVESKTLSGQDKAKALDVLSRKVDEQVDPLWHLINLIERGDLQKKKGPKG